MLSLESETAGATVDFAFASLFDQLGLGAWRSRSDEDSLIKIEHSKEPSAPQPDDPGLWFFHSEERGESTYVAVDVQGKALPCIVPAYGGRLPGRPCGNLRLAGGEVFTIRGQRLYCALDLPRLFHEILARREEFNGKRDLHDRFALESSALQPCIGIPVLDLWGRCLRQAVDAAGWGFPRLEVGEECEGPLAALTHDVDRMDRVAKRPADSVAEKGVARFFSYLGSRLAEGSRAVRVISRMEKEFNWPAAYYFLGQRKGTVNVGYAISEQELRREMALLRESGHEMGLHGSYDAMNSPEMLGREAGRIRQLAGAELRGGRMHYLRVRWPETLRHWADIGMEYDASLGYTAAPGFRAGTSRPFPVFDDLESRLLDIWELPFSMMDCALLSAMKMGLEEAKAYAEQQIRLLAEWEGCIVLLFHPCRLTTDGNSYGDLYQHCLEILSSLHARVFTPGCLCEGSRGRSTAVGSIRTRTEESLHLSLEIHSSSTGFHLRAPGGWRISRASLGRLSCGETVLHLEPGPRRAIEIAMQKNGTKTCAAL